MAIRNISVKVTANVSQYVKAMGQASKATKTFAQSANTSGSMGNVSKGMRDVAQSTGVANGQLNMFKRAMGNELARSAGHTSAVMHRSNKIFKATSQEVGILSKGMAALKVATVATMSAFTGFIFINSAIQAVKGFFATTIGGFTEFNTAIKETMAIIPDVGGEIEKAFTESALAISKVTKFSPGEVAEGFYFLASAGYTAQQSLAGMEQVTRFAQAGVMDLAQAAEMAADTVAALGLADAFDPKGTGEALERVTDVMVHLARQSNATVKQFGEAFTNKFANMLNITNKSVEEGAAILGVFANQGVKGQIAGTRASMALRDLQRAAIKNSSEFQRFNIAVFDANGNMRNTADIITDMENALAGMSDEQQKATLQMLGFQDRSVQALLALIGNADAMRALEESMKSAGGAVKEVSEKQMESLKNKANVVISVIKSLSTEIGNKLMGVVASAVEEITPAVVGLKDAFESVWGTVKVMATPFVMMAGGAVVAGFKAIKFAMEAIAKAFEIAEVPMTTLVVLLGAKWLGVASKFTAATSAMGASLMRFNSISQAVQSRRVGVNMTQGMPFIQRQIEGARGAMQGFSKSIGGVRGAFRSLGGAVSGFINPATAAFAALTFAITGVFNAINKGKESINEMFANVDTSKVESLRGAIEDLREERDKAIVEAGDNRGFFGQIGKYFAGVGQFLNPKTPNSIFDSRGQASQSQALIEEYQETLAKINSTTRDIQAQMPVSADIIQSKAREIGVALDVTGSQADQAVTTVVGALQEESEAFEGASVESGDFADSSVEDWDQAADAAEENAKEIAKTLTELYGPAGAIERAAERSKILFESLYSPSEVFSNLMEDFESAAEEAADAQADAFNKGLEAQQDAVEKARDSRIDAIEKARDKELDALDEVKEKTKKRLQEGVDDAKDAAKERYDAEIDAVKESADAESDAIKDKQKSGDDFYEEPSIGLQTLLDGMKEAAVKTRNFNDLLMQLSDSGAGNAVISMFREMGEEAIPYMDALLNDAKGKLNEFKLFAEALQNDETRIDTTAVQEELEANAEAGRRMGMSLVNLFQDPRLKQALSAEGILPEGATMKTVVEALIGMGPEGVQLINEMSDTIATGGEDAVEEVKNIFSDVAWGSDFMGIYSAMETTLDALQSLSQASAQELTELWLGSQEMLKQETVNNLAKFQELLGLDQINGIDFTAIASGGTSGGPASRAASQAFAEGETGGMAPFGEMNAFGVLDLYKRNVESKITESDRYWAEFWMKDLGNRQNLYNFRQLVAWYMKPGGNKGGNFIGNLPTFADGGIHQAQIARGGDLRIWNEPETGGEAYIPLAMSKRARSESILAQVAKEFGYGITKFANGGIAPGVGMIGGTRYGTTASQPQIVVVPMTQQNVTEFNGPIQGVDMDDAMRFAERKKRQARLGN